MAMLSSQRLRGRFFVLASLVFGLILVAAFARADVHRRLLPVLRYTHVLRQEEQRPMVAGPATVTPVTATSTPTPSPAPPSRLQLPPGRCSPDAELLRSPRLGLSDTVVYTKRCVTPLRSARHDREVVANISAPLFSHRTTLDLATCSPHEPAPCEPLQLNVPEAYPAKAYRHLIFGVASNLDRLNESLPAFAHWLAGTEARLVAVVVDASDLPNSNTSLAALGAAYAAYNVSATFIPPSMTAFIPSKKDPNPRDRATRKVPTEHHHFMLIRDLLARATSQTRWLGVLDDDTFFPALHPLDEALSRYDHKRPTWLGALSDNFEHVKIWGFMAFGGAGVFLSPPLARQLEPVLESCIRDADAGTGDGILRDCVWAHSRARLTVVPGLNQHDLLADASGFYESGVAPLSVHHWKSWYREDVVAQAAVGRVCGGCYLQRWRFGADTVLANGYSVTVYDGGLDGVDLERMEATWVMDGQKNGPGFDFNFSYGPLRPKMGDRKKSYRLKDVGTTAAGGFRQIYVYKSKENGGRDEVVELVWEADDLSQRIQA